MKSIKLALIVFAIVFSSCKREEVEILTQGEKNVREIEKIIEESGINSIVIFYGVLNPNGVFYSKTLAKGVANNYYFRHSFICSRNECYDLSRLIKTEIFDNRTPYVGTKTLEIHLSL